MKGMSAPRRVLWYFAVQSKRPFEIPIPALFYASQQGHVEIAERLKAVGAK